VIGAIVLNWNTRELLLACVESLLAQEVRQPLHVVVVDNASTDGSVAAVARHFPGVKVCSMQQNVGFARANNAAASMLLTECSTIESLLFANADTRFFQRDAVQRLRARLGTGYGIVAPRLVNPDGSLQPSCAPFPTLLPTLAMATGVGRVVPDRWRVLTGTRWSHSSGRTVPWVKGAVVMVDAALWIRLGGFFEDEFMYGEDLDLSWRARELGQATFYAADAAVEHVDDASSSLIWEDAERARRVAQTTARFVARHYGGRRAGFTRTAAVTGAWARAFAFAIFGKRAAVKVQRAIAYGWKCT
jgi:N-acetylglucosaminyl-diphospho-decaprenol L-rhamnosyltransferase